jgi:hypothetical protein
VLTEKNRVEVCCGHFCVRVFKLFISRGVQIPRNETLSLRIRYKF